MPRDFVLTTTVLLTQIRKTPNIPKADSKNDGSQNELDFVTPCTSRQWLAGSSKFPPTFSIPFTVVISGSSRKERVFERRSRSHTRNKFVYKNYNCRMKHCVVFFFYTHVHMWSYLVSLVLY